MSETAVYHDFFPPNHTDSLQQEVVSVVAFKKYVADLKVHILSHQFFSVQSLFFFFMFC